MRQQEWVFRSYSQVAADVREWSRRLPDYVAVAGIPRSGTIIAAMLAQFRNIHLVDIRDLPWAVSPPWAVPLRRGVAAADPCGRVLVVDDTSWSGRTIAECRLAVGGPLVEFGALYYGDLAASVLDRRGRRLPTPHHTFEYNMLRDCLTGDMLFDMDGVLCEDWNKSDIGKMRELHEEHIRHAAPLYSPPHPILGIVTARMEKFRPETEAWLESRGVRYGSLQMAPFLSEEARERYGHARYKADVYSQRRDAQLFVESSDEQSREIWARTGRPVLSVGGMKLYGGTEVGEWE